MSHVLWTESFLIGVLMLVFNELCFFFYRKCESKIRWLQKCPIRFWYLILCYYESELLIAYQFFAVIVVFKCPCITYVFWMLWWLSYLNTPILLECLNVVVLWFWLNSLVKTIQLGIKSMFLTLEYKYSLLWKFWIWID